MINYSTKAQRSPFLTSVLLISFCSVLRSSFSVFLLEKKKKTRKCKYIFTYPDFHFNIQKQMYSFSALSKSGYVTGAWILHFVFHYVAFLFIKL